MLVIETYISKINANELHTEKVAEKLEAASVLIKAGQVVAFPTETVYGLGADAYNSQAVSKIFEAKGRPSDNPLIVHIYDIEQAKQLIDQDKFDDKLEKRLQMLADNFWPGPLTCVVPANRKLASNVTANLTTVGLRIPDHPVALAFLKKVKLPIAAPSANISGKPSPTTADHVYHDLNGKIPMILDGGKTGIGVESTVLDISSEIPMILRPGGVSLEELQNVVGQVVTDPAVQLQFSNEGIYEETINNPRSPGMKYAHYAPKGKVFVFFKESTHKVVEILENVPNDESVGIICSHTTNAKYFLPFADRINFLITHQEDPQEIATDLYQWLRDVDQQNIKRIYIEALTSEGLGYAIMNRLVKASGGRIICS